MNKKIESLLKEVNSNEEKYRLTLIQDIIQAHKFLYAQGDSQYTDSVFKPAALFDKLYEQTINDLQIEDSLLNTKCTKAMQTKLDLLKQIKTN